MSSVKLIGVTKPTLYNIVGEEGIWEDMSAEDLVAYCARVSNPSNQLNTGTATKLLKYLVKHKHWSPFEMVHVVMQIETTRDIARQILRHRSFSFQEFSQRYAVVDFQSFKFREARMQDLKNRQNSVEMNDNELAAWWREEQEELLEKAVDIYASAIGQGIAKEVARAVLPEGMSPTTMYMSGSLRSWIHYCELRMGNGTQKEHREVANQCWDVIVKEFPSLKEIFDEEQ